MATAVPPLNYTTTIAVSKTLGEVQALLARRGAAAVAFLYTDGNPTGVTFQIDTAHGLRTYSLPVDVEAMGRLLVAARRSNGRVKATPEQAARVAWRVMKDWLAAQLSLIDATMATIDQVMLPYLLVGGRTMFEHYQEFDLAPMIERGP